MRTYYVSLNFKEGRKTLRLIHAGLETHPPELRYWICATEEFTNAVSSDYLSYGIAPSAHRAVNEWVLKNASSLVFKAAENI